MKREKLSNLIKNEFMRLWFVSVLLSKDYACPNVRIIHYDSNNSINISGK